MDLSKLPKLSKTDQPPVEEALPQFAAPQASVPVAGMSYSAEPLPGLAEGWISIALGLILLFVFPNTISYLRSPSTFEQNYPVMDAQGNPLPYIKSAFFWTDLGVAVFAGVLLIEGFVLAVSRKSGPIYVAFGLTVSAALLNLFVIIHTFNILGFPIYCGLAVAVSVYMALTQWRLIQMLRIRGR
ncbi:MAG: hypothetical protein M3O30_04600 [Planctomycetota bacterium]|nr:hypothetical protein [Planctomycetota bacterium]